MSAAQTSAQRSSAPSRRSGGSQSHAVAPTVDVTNLHELVDLCASIRLSTDAVVQGRIYAFDPLSGYLALECATTSRDTSSATVGPTTRRDYRLIRLTQIKDVSPLEDACLPRLEKPVSVRPVSTAAVQGIEKAALKAEEQRLARKGPPGVSGLGQELFDAIAKTLPARWQSTTIVILDDVLISPPYDTASGPPSAKLDRVRKVLDGERAKVLRARTERERAANAAQEAGPAKR